MHHPVCLENTSEQKKEKEKADLNQTWLIWFHSLMKTGADQRSQGGKAWPSSLVSGVTTYQSVWLVKLWTFLHALKTSLSDSELMMSVGLSTKFTDVLKAISLLRGSEWHIYGQINHKELYSMVSLFRPPQKNVMVPRLLRLFNCYLNYTYKNKKKH